MMLCREDLVMKIEYPNGDSLVEDPLGSRVTTFADQRWQVQVAGFAPVSGSTLEGRVDIVPGEPLALEHLKPLVTAYPKSKFGKRKVATKGSGLSLN